MLSCTATFCIPCKRERKRLLQPSHALQFANFHVKTAVPRYMRATIGELQQRLGMWLMLLRSLAITRWVRGASHSHHAPPYPRLFFLCLAATDIFNEGACAGLPGGIICVGRGVASCLKELEKLWASASFCTFWALFEYMSNMPTWPPVALRFCASSARSICSSMDGSPTAARTAHHHHVSAPTSTASRTAAPLALWTGPETGPERSKYYAAP